MFAVFSKFRSHAAPVALIAAIALSAPVPAAAQFGSLLRSRPSPSPSTASSESPCKDDAGTNVGRSVMRGLLGGAARRAGVSSSWVPIDDVAGVLSDAIACKLDPEEQKQAADATLEATRGEEVGSTSTWESGTRKNVSGTSTVTGREDLAEGTRCLTVTDVVIVEGEETKVDKRMCKAPGDSRYTMLA